MCITYLVVAMVFFGLTLGGSSLGVDPFVYMVISGLMELPSIVTVFLAEYFGRKRTGIGTFTLCAVSLLTQPLIPESKCGKVERGAWKLSSILFTSISLSYSPSASLPIRVSAVKDIVNVWRRSVETVLSTFYFDLFPILLLCLFQYESQV